MKIETKSGWTNFFLEQEIGQNKKKNKENIFFILSPPKAKSTSKKAHFMGKMRRNGEKICLKSLNECLKSPWFSWSVALHLQCTKNEAKTILYRRHKPYILLLGQS